MSSEQGSVQRTVSAGLQWAVGKTALLEGLGLPKLDRRRNCGSETGKVTFSVCDDRPGVDAEAIEVYIDGPRIIVEYEEEKHRVNSCLKTSLKRTMSY